jgi:hypothetical protein
MSVIHTPDPERLFEGFENLMSTGHMRFLRIVIICHIMKLCL